MWFYGPGVKDFPQGLIAQFWLLPYLLKIPSWFANDRGCHLSRVLESFLFLLGDWTSKIFKSRKYREHLMLSSALFSSVFSQCNLMSHCLTCHRIKKGTVIKPLCLKHWAKGLRRLFNTSNRTWLLDFPSIFQSLPITQV